MVTQNRGPFRSSVTILALLLAGFVFAAMSLPGVELQNDLETWLAEDDPQSQALSRMYEYFPKRERILVSWDDSALDDQRLAEFGTAIGKSQYVDDVETAADLVERMRHWKVASDEAIRRLTGVLIGSFPQSPVSSLVTLSPAGERDPGRAIQAIRNAAVDAGVARESVRIDGAVVTSQAVDEEVRTAAWNAVDPVSRPPVFAISGLAGIVLGFLVLGNFRLGMMVAFVAWCVALVTTSLLPFVGRPMNMVTIVMPTLLVVLTISAAIHMANYWKRAVAGGSSRPIQAAIRMGWLPCLLASATTAAGLLSLSISRLEPIRDFGLYSSIGVLLSFFGTLVAFPAMLRLWPVKTHFDLRRNTSFWKWVARLVGRHHRKIIFASLITGVVAAYGLRYLKTEVKVARYFPDESRLLQDARFFEDRIGGTISLEVLVHFDESSEDTIFFDRMEQIRTVTEKIRRHPAITGAISLADFQPDSRRPAGASGFAKMKHRVRNRRAESSIKSGKVESSRRFLSISRDGTQVWDEGDPIDETWRIVAQTKMDCR